MHDRNLKHSYKIKIDKNHLKKIEKFECSISIWCGPRKFTMFFFFISATTEKTFVRDKFEEINFTFSSSDLKPII